jgi:hypothetical protein
VAPDTEMTPGGFVTMQIQNPKEPFATRCSMVLLKTPSPHKSSQRMFDVGALFCVRAQCAPQRVTANIFFFLDLG